MDKLLRFVAIVLCCFACSQNEQSPQEGDFYIRFKVDGQFYEYEVSSHPAVFFYDANLSMYHGSVLVPRPGSDGTKDFIQIIVRNESEIKVGETYHMQDAILANSVPLPRINLTWANPEGLVYNAVLLKSSYPGLSIANDAQVKYTEIGPQIIRGEFSGIVIGPNLASSSNPQLHITDGEFKLKRGGA
ncbi:MAG: hypothetical protein JJU34_11635 [Lunatimonas sp.]|uniref:hypothetical protein n=1 Tax=Lunatimonas sp. TaxID=2060141 RepID=UPI00263B1555|nr:hypothetical protein [Lunatimonas sp.]MCC5937922.1 hypothetical protein [Lunatimonas sp.]